MPSAGKEGKTKLSETEVITTVKEIRLQPQGFEMTENSPIIPLGIRDGGTVVCVEVMLFFRFFSHWLFFNHSTRLWSGRCLTLKSEKRALKPFPSGHAATGPTCNGQLSFIQSVRIMVYFLSSKL